MSNSNQAQAQRIVCPVLAYVSNGKSLGMYATLTYSGDQLVSCMSHEPVEALIAKLSASGDGEYQDMQVMSLDAYMVKKAELDMDEYKVGIPTPISAKRFDEMLNVLPPERWEFNKDLGNEAFRMSEAITGDLHSFFIRMDKTYFEVVHHRYTSYSVLFKACKEFNSVSDLPQVEAV